ncbi:MAG: DeoR family transcriptional regulator [Patescibacteria group bacterium]
MDRQTQIFKAIVQHFIETAEPVGSNTLFVSYSFKVSPATIRNDMAALEDKGYIYQPHTSAGRIPTTTGYRHFIDTLADYETARKKVHLELQKVHKEYKAQKARSKIFDAVALLSRAAGNVSFATLPDNNRTFYLGLSSALRQPEFRSSSINASEVIEVLEKSDNFITTLRNLDIGEDVKVFVGEENILHEIQSCSIIVTKYQFEDYHGYFGILGPVRMDYAYNIVMTQEIKKLLENN